MLRKMMIALMATVALGLIVPGAASARGGGGGFHGGGFGGFHGGGFGGFHGGGFHGGPHFAGGFHHGFGRHVFIAGGGYVPYGYYDDGYYSDYGYPDQVYYDDGGGYVEEGSCIIVHHRVHTRHGWRYRTVQDCQ